MADVIISEKARGYADLARRCAEWARKSTDQTCNYWAREYAESAREYAEWARYYAEQARKYAKWARYYAESARKEGWPLW